MAIPLPVPRPMAESYTNAPRRPSLGAANLDLGDMSSSVAAVQQFLVQQGFPIDVDGHYGPQTKNAVMAYQKRSGLPADGVVGPQTMAAIQRDVAMPAPRANPLGQASQRGSATFDPVGAFQGQVSPPPPPPTVFDQAGAFGGGTPANLQGQMLPGNLQGGMAYAAGLPVAVSRDAATRLGQGMGPISGPTPTVTDVTPAGQKFGYSEPGLLQQQGALPGGATDLSRPLDLDALGLSPRPRQAVTPPPPPAAPAWTPGMAARTPSPGSADWYSALGLAAPPRPAAAPFGDPLGNRQNLFANPEYIGQVTIDPTSGVPVRWNGKTWQPISAPLSFASP